MANEYNKRPLWQWILIYVVIGGIAYGLIYYLVLSKKGGYSYGGTTSQQTPTTSQQTTTTSATPSAKNAIQISNYSFSPATLTVNVGDTVTWTNQDSMDHSATADDKSFDTGLLGQGKSGTITLSKAGTYTYHCSVHSYMHGTIIVK